jgi:hypothetical protein
MGSAQVSLIYCNDVVKASPVMMCPAAERATLDFLRTCYQTCRTKPRHDLFVACDLLTCDRHVATKSYAETILRTLSQTLGRRPIILRPGDVVVTFDESWLLALLNACGNENRDNIAFLANSRVKPLYRPNLLYLISGLAKLMRSS